MFTDIFQGHGKQLRYFTIHAPESFQCIKMVVNDLNRTQIIHVITIGYVMRKECFIVLYRYTQMNLNASRFKFETFLMIINYLK